MGFLVLGAKAEDEEMDPTTTDSTLLLILVTMAMGAVVCKLVVYMVDLAFRPSPGPALGRVQLVDGEGSAGSTATLPASDVVETGSWMRTMMTQTAYTYTAVRGVAWSRFATISRSVAEVVEEGLEPMVIVRAGSSAAPRKVDKQTQSQTTSLRGDFQVFQ